jgi:cellulose synthase/poly-beta-1,6-N-acetylglucosamine synthase-like glycosyltransferase
MSVYHIYVSSTGIFLLAYGMLIAFYHRWFKRLHQFEAAANIQPCHRFSVIIPARNEANCIKTCIESIMKNEYPSNLFEVLVIDDFSTDATAAIVSNLMEKYSNLQLVRLAHWISSPINSYKKKAIETGIMQAGFEWIVTTDADCVVPTSWLRLYDSHLQQYHNKLVAAPVMFTDNGSLLQIFQCLDFVSLQGITAASVSAGFHSMCNGANLCYEKSAFEAVNGFSGVDNIASGDDMLLMFKIQKKFGGSTGYIFSQGAIVYTAPMPDWKSFFNQRIRWASKASKFQDKRVFFVLLLVYLTNISIFILIPLSFLSYKYILWCVCFMLLKAAIEWPFIRAVSVFFKKEKAFTLFFLFQPIHIFYTVVAGWLGKAGTYSWKDRQVK